MEDIVVEVCGVCMKDDNRGNAEVVDWVECSKCNLWVHAGLL